MIKECLSKLRALPKKVENLKKKSEDVDFKDLKPGVNYQDHSDQVIIFVVDQPDGSKLFEFGDKKGDKWSGTYDSRGILHGPLKYETEAFQCTMMALNGELCGRGTVTAKEYAWEFVACARTDTYVMTAKQKDIVVSHDCRYRGHHTGFSKIYRWETESLIKVSTYLAGYEHGLQGTWFKDGTARRKVLKEHGIAHGIFVNYHFDGSKAESGDLFMGERTGVWTAWVVSMNSTPHKTLENIFTPAIPIDWLSRLLTDEGEIIKLSKETPASVLVDHRVRENHTANGYLMPLRGGPTAPTPISF